MGERRKIYGPRLLLVVEDGTVCAVPPQWTDLAVPDAEVVMGNGRGLVRVADLLDLATLVDRLKARGAATAAAPCHVNSAAHVNQTTPRLVGGGIGHVIE